MRKAYLLGPILGLVLFGVVYWQFIGGYKERQEAAAQAIEDAKLAKKKQEVANQATAVEQAKQFAEQRKKEKAEREDRERREKEALLSARDVREKALRDQDRYEKQVKRLTEEVAAEDAVLAKLAEQQKAHREEQEFLKGFVGKADANVKNLLAVLDRIAAADAAAAKAAQIAAAAAKKSE